MVFYKSTFLRALKCCGFQGTYPLMLLEKILYLLTFELIARLTYEIQEKIVPHE